MSGKKQDKQQSIIIRKNEVVEGGHHGGAWKVAYADFVTAMMAFFLLMWLLNATTQEQRRGLADYFSQANVMSRSSSGIGAPFGGRTPNLDGALASDRGSVDVTSSAKHPIINADDDQADTETQATPDQPGPAPVARATDGAPATSAVATPAAPATTAATAAAAPTPAPAATEAKPTQEDIQKEVEKRERQEFERATQQIKDAVRSDPALADIAKQLMIDITPQGLRIQLLDADRSPMFNTGSSALNDRARAVLTKVGPILMRMSEGIAISGHTDSAPYRGGERSNWDLSAERANATRRLLVEAGLPEARLRSVTGNADRDPLIAADPMAAANRRVAIMVLRDRATPSR